MPHDFMIQVDDVIEARLEELLFGGYLTRGVSGISPRPSGSQADPGGFPRSLL
jgi:hypothetical protein